MVLLDADQQGFAYLKRFCLERASQSRHANFMGDNPKSQRLLLTDTPYPCLRITLGGNDAFREPIVLDAEAYVAVKGFKAKGKRITTFAVSSVEELEPVRQPDADPADDGSADPADPADAADSRPDVLLPDETREDIEDEIYGQGRLF